MNLLPAGKVDFIGKSFANKLSKLVAFIKPKKEPFVPERIIYKGLPNDILVCYSPLKQVRPDKGSDLAESHSGSVLIRQMAEHWFNEEHPQIETSKSEKPRLAINGKEVSVSFSHTKKAISAAMSGGYNVGCDMEALNRTVSPGLVRRMKHEDEPDTLYESLPAIQIWTLKESVLKMIGTGLRKPMNGVKLTRIDQSLFDVEIFDDKPAKICSFQHQEHWISISFQT